VLQEARIEHVRPSKNCDWVATNSNGLSTLNPSKPPLIISHGAPTRRRNLHRLPVYRAKTTLRHVTATADQSAST